MNDKLREHIEGLFRGAPQTRQIVEFKEEILQNTIDRYNDLLSEGKSEQAAYNIAIAGIGDVRSIIDSMIQDDPSAAYVPQNEPSDKKPAKRTNPVEVAICAALWVLLSVFYVLISLATEMWSVTWLIFPITVAIENVIHAIFDLCGK